MSVIDDLLASVPEAHRKELERVRAIVKEECPDAEEVMTYGMPGFKYKQKYLLSFSSFKDHMSLFPGADPVDNLKDELAPYKTSKGTIQFTPEKNISDELVRKIVDMCKARIDANAK